MSKRKYTPGARLTSLTDVVRRLERGEYIYWRNKPLHPQWLSHWSVAQLSQAVRGGVLREALSAQEPVMDAEFLEIVP